MACEQPVSNESSECRSNCQIVMLKFYYICTQFKWHEDRMKSGFIFPKSFRYVNSPRQSAYRIRSSYQSNCNNNSNDKDKGNPTFDTLKCSHSCINFLSKHRIKSMKVTVKRHNFECCTEVNCSFCFSMKNESKKKRENGKSVIGALSRYNI